MNFTLLAVFGAGLATFLSPCVLPLAPVLTANLMSAGSKNRWGKLLSTIWFGIGFTLAFVIMGLGLSFLVNIFPHARVILIGLSAVVLGFFGLKMAGFIDKGSKMPLLNRSFQMPVFIKKLPMGLHGLFLGAGFGVSWTPCVGPILGGVLTYVASQERSLVEGSLLLTSFSLGIVLPLLAIAFVADSLLPRVRSLNRYTPKIESLAGYGLLFFSLYMMNQAYLNMPSAAQVAEAAQPSIKAQNVLPSASSAVSPEAGNGLSRTKMLFFYSDNCPICHAMEGFLPKFEAECQSDSFQFVRINVDQVGNMALANQFNVRAVPTISVLDARGKEFIHLIGYQSEGRLRDAARSVSRVACASAGPELKSKQESEQPVEEGLTCSVGNRC